MDEMKFVDELMELLERHEVEGKCGVTPFELSRYLWICVCAAGRLHRARAEAAARPVEEFDGAESYELRQIAARCMATLAPKVAADRKADARDSVKSAEALMREFVRKGYLPPRHPED